MAEVQSWTLRRPASLHATQRLILERLAQDLSIQQIDKAHLRSSQRVTPRGGKRLRQFKVSFFWCQRTVLMQMALPLGPHALSPSARIVHGLQTYKRLAPARDGARLTGRGYLLAQLGELGLGFKKADDLHANNIPTSWLDGNRNWRLVPPATESCSASHLFLPSSTRGLQLG